MMNPPYSQGSKQSPDLYEIAFTEHLLNSLSVGARCAVIVPKSTMTGKSKEEASIKANILKKHTLEGVITLNKDTFYGVGTMPCIVVFIAGEPHPTDKICKFINFEDDGYKVIQHIGLLETESAKDKKQHLLDVWFNRIGIDKNKLLDSKEFSIPYIIRSDFNNGVSLFVGKEQKEKFKIDNGNVITIGLDTQMVFYQPYLFYTGQNIQILYNDKLNKFVVKFIIPLIKMQVSKLSWGYKWCNIR